MNFENGIVSPQQQQLTVMRYLRSSSESPSPPFKMMEEDVLVFDGVLLPSSSTASNRQFVHGKEELYPTRFSAKKKSEVYGKTYPLGSSSFSPTHPLLPLFLMEAANQKPSPTGAPEYPCKSPSSFTASPECTSKNSTPTATPELLSRTPSAIIRGIYDKRPATVNRPGESRPHVTASDCWSPQDDGIMVGLPGQTDKCSSRKDVDRYIENALYGSTRKKRLPVFTEICSDN